MSEQQNKQTPDNSSTLVFTICRNCSQQGRNVLTLCRGCRVRLSRKRDLQPDYASITLVPCVEPDIGPEILKLFDESLRIRGLYDQDQQREHSAIIKAKLAAAEAKALDDMASFRRQMDEIKQAVKEEKYARKQATIQRNRERRSYKILDCAYNEGPSQSKESSIPLNPLPQGSIHFNDIGSSVDPDLRGCLARFNRASVMFHQRARRLPSSFDPVILESAELRHEFIQLLYILGLALESNKEYAYTDTCPKHQC
jgi:hypothetical protein